MSNTQENFQTPLLSYYLTTSTPLLHYYLIVIIIIIQKIMIVINDCYLVASQWELFPRVPLADRGSGVHVVVMLQSYSTPVPVILRPSDGGSREQWKMLYNTNLVKTALTTATLKWLWYDCQPHRIMLCRKAHEPHMFLHFNEAPFETINNSLSFNPKWQ